MGGGQVLSAPWFLHTSLGWDAPGTRSMLQLLWGRGKVGQAPGVCGGAGTTRSVHGGGGSQGRAEGWHSMQNWRYWGTCGWAEGFWVPDPGRDWVRVPGARAGPEAPGEGHWLWCRYQAPKQMLSAIRAASTPSCMPWACPREMGGNVPNMASILRVSREQRVQAASRAGGPADDNLFHGSYAYGTAPASESTRTFPRNKQ